MKRKRKIIIAVAVVLVVVCTLAAVKILQIKKMGAFFSAAGTPPEYVSSVVAREEKWQDSLKAIGSVAAVHGLTVSPEIAGTITEITFESGAVVNKGDLLIRMDTASEEAQLRSIETQSDLAKINADRMRRLRAENTISQSELDAAESSWKQYQANADALRATIAKKNIRAPFAGNLGIRLVHVGEYVDAGKPMVSLQSLSPVYADFSLPQKELARLQPGMSMRISTDTYSNREFQGSLTAIDPDLDAATRNVQLQGTFENAEQLLRPGMFARVAVLLPTEQNVLIVPATAVLSAPYGDSVFVIAPASNTNASSTNLIARQQFVRLGQTRGDFVDVVSGLSAGERVVSAGVFKLRNGVAIVEKNDLAPSASETPRPVNR